MDWTAAVESNREALKRIVALLAAMAGVGASDGFAQDRHSGNEVARAGSSNPSPALTLPRRLYHAVLRLLLPAEAAVRRLVIVAARGMVLAPSRLRKRGQASPSVTAPVSMPAERPRRAATLALLDPLRPRRSGSSHRPAGGVPRISLPGLTEPFRLQPRSPEVDATRLVWRLEALARALDDLPGHARRFARWRARVAVPSGGGNCEPQNSQRFRRVWPLKPGHPPGWRRRRSHEVHEILDVVHGLAFWALEAPDTS